MVLFAEESPFDNVGLAYMRLQDRMPAPTMAFTRNQYMLSNSKRSACGPWRGRMVAA